MAGNGLLCALESGFTCGFESKAVWLQPPARKAKPPTASAVSSRRRTENDILTTSRPLSLHHLTHDTAQGFELLARRSITRVPLTAGTGCHHAAPWRHSLR